MPVFLFYGGVCIASLQGAPRLYGPLQAPAAGVGGRSAGASHRTFKQGAERGSKRSWAQLEVLGPLVEGFDADGGRVYSKEVPT